MTILVKKGKIRFMDNVLYIFSGLPGTGKTTLAKEISKILRTVYIRIDTIEQGIRDLWG